jgi:hypothetical protein
MAFYTNANITATIPQVWADFMNEAKFPQFVLQNHVTDLSDYVVDGGRIIHVPNLFTNVFTASTQATEGTDVLTSGVAQNVAQVDVTLTINTHQFVSWVIGDMDMQQVAAKYDLSKAYAREAMSVLLQALEDALFGLYTSLTATAVGSASAMADLTIRQAISYMDTNNFEADRTAFFFHPVVYWTQITGLAKFNPNYSSNLNVIKTGLLGEGSSTSKAMGVLYGRPVYISSRVILATTYKNLLLHTAAFGFGLQKMDTNGGKVRVDIGYERRQLSWTGIVDIRYGVGVLRADAGIALLSDASTVA